MDPTETSAALVEALRMGLQPEQVRWITIPITVQQEVFTIRATGEGDYPLLLCLHPPRFTEFQFAQKVRDLCRLRAHLVFPRGLHAHLVDLGGARTVGFDWCHYTGDNPAFRKSLAAATSYIDQVLDEALARLPVDRRMIYLVGTEGGTLFASIYGVARSDVFAGIITVGGHLLPEVIAEHLPEQKRVPFLCLNRRRIRPGHFREEISVGPNRIEDLRRLGFPVTHEILRGDLPPWHEEVAIILSWLTQQAGFEVAQEGASERA
jgi:predicted esterase